MLLDMQRATRCGAKTRRGTPCQSPAMPNGRCRMHGGPSTGAPEDGLRLRRAVRFLLKEARNVGWRSSDGLQKMPVRL
jgi:hypothetical protein